MGRGASATVRGGMMFGPRRRQDTRAEAQSVFDQHAFKLSVAYNDREGMISLLKDAQDEQECISALSAMAGLSLGSDRIDSELAWEGTRLLMNVPEITGQITRRVEETNMCLDRIVGTEMRTHEAVSRVKACLQDRGHQVLLKEQNAEHLIMIPSEIILSRNFYSECVSAIAKQTEPFLRRVRSAMLAHYDLGRTARRLKAADYEQLARIFASGDSPDTVESSVEQYLSRR
jgi:hypothetical protein